MYVCDYVCVCFYHVADQQNWMQLPTWEFEKTERQYLGPGPVKENNLQYPNLKVRKL